MVVLIVENVKKSLRGFLTRWMIEPKSGIFAGNISPMVREHLWQMVKNEINAGGATIIYTDNNEQGYKIEMTGKNSRRVVDFEGISLICSPETER